MEEYYRVRAHGIARETIEAETIVLNLETGTYFSLTQGASLAWTLLEGGATEKQMTEGLGRRYRGDPAHVEAAVREFVASLLREAVIERHTDPSPTVPAELDAGDEPFPGLGIQRYSDVEELLMIDPVHEVDESGWPVQPEKT